jgi:hypothetical protein
MLWTLTSMHTWEDLVIDSGCARDRHVPCTTDAVRMALLA